MNVNVQIHTKGDNYIVICVENVTELKSTYDIVRDINIFTIKSEELTIIGDENRIEKIEKWGNGSLKELYNNVPTNPFTE